jgi:hypothetical protein
VWNSTAEKVTLGRDDDDDDSLLLLGIELVNIRQIDSACVRNFMQPSEAGSNGGVVL